MPSRIRGFTLVELLVVIAICGMLLGLLLPVTQYSRSRRAVCMSYQSQIAMAFLNYDNARGQFPGWRQTLPNGREISWPVALLPLMEQNKLWEMVSAKPEEGKEPPEIEFPPIYILQCKSAAVDQTDLRTAYVANCGKMDATADAIGPKNPSGYTTDDDPKNGVLFDNVNSTTSVSVDYISTRDGTSYTLLLSESLQGGRYMDPVESAIGFCFPDASFTGQDRNACGKTVVSVFVNRCRTETPEPPGTLGEYRLARPSSNHPGVVVAAFCDRSTRTISEKIDPTLFDNLMKTDSGAKFDPKTLE